MKTTQKTQLNLFNPFFDKELDYNNNYVSYIIVGGSSSVTPKNNNNITSQNKKYRIAQDKYNLDIDCRFAVGLTWSDASIDKAFSKYKKMFSDCVIVLVHSFPQPHNNALSLV